MCRFVYCMTLGDSPIIKNILHVYYWDYSKLLVNSYYMNHCSTAAEEGSQLRGG